jgi:hypothetical protein
MIRWLSELWVSSAADRGVAPPRLWRWTLGRLPSQRRFEADLRELDGQLTRQAESQRLAVEQKPYPIGDYPARRSEAAGPPGPATGLVNRYRPALAVAFGCAVLGVSAWIAWPTAPAYRPETYDATRVSFAKLWEPISEHAQTTGDALREQTVHVTSLPDRFASFDEVVNGLGASIETPIREEMRRLARDMSKPWVYFANQLPRPARETTPDQAEG